MFVVDGDADNEDAVMVVIAVVVIVPAAAVVVVVVVVIGMEFMDILDNCTTAAEEGDTGVNDDRPPIPPIGKTLLPWSWP